MNDFAVVLGVHHSAAAILAHPVATNWLSGPAVLPRLSQRQRRLALCVTADGVPAFLSPCFLLNNRFALCVHQGPLQPPTHVWWSSESLPCPSHPARAVVDLMSGAVVEAHHFPGSGLVMRAFVVEHLSSGSGPTATLYASSSDPRLQSGTAQITYKRNCPVCLPIQQFCSCERSTTLQSVSVQQDHSLNMPPPWTQFGEQLHASLHGLLFACATVTMSVPLGASGGSYTPQSAQQTRYSPIMISCSVTINDPRVREAFAAQQRGAAEPSHSPRLLLPRPESVHHLAEEGSHLVSAHSGAGVSFQPAPGTSHPEPFVGNPLDSAAIMQGTNPVVHAESFQDRAAGAGPQTGAGADPGHDRSGAF